jgi:competence protein ComEC
MRAPPIRAPHVLAGALCLGLAGSLALPVAASALAVAAAGLALVAPFATGSRRLAALALALALLGAWWGANRLEALDTSVLAGRVGESALARVEVTGPARPGLYAQRVPVRVRRFDRRTLSEPARLELPLGRAPPQGAILELVATVKAPRGPDGADSFDEAAYLRRQGVHAILRAGSYREVGRRGGVPGVVDRLRAQLASSIAPGLTGERRALIAGVVLGDDQKLSEPLRDDFRASGLYHLLAVSGQNVAYVVIGILLIAWVAGIPRWLAQLAALAGVLGYTGAVGWQPSVVRAGVAGGLVSLAWLASRPTDRWYFMLVGAAVLLAVNPYSLLEAGFQLSFVAVAAIFVLVPRIERRLEGYPLPGKVAEGLALSVGCGLATMPVLWLQFGAVPVYTVLANVLAAPVVPFLLGLALACAALDPVLPSAAAALAWANGWLAAYLAWCARFVGGLPHARVTSLEALALAGLVCGAALVALRLRPPRGQRVVALGLMVVTLAVGWRVWIADDGAAAAPPAGLRVTFLDVGQGDGTLLQVPEGAILVDEGPPEARVADQLEGLGVRRLAAVVLTHPERDHVGGAATVLDRIPVGFVLDPRIPSDSPDESSAIHAAHERHVPVVIARAGQRYRLGKLVVRVLWPDGPGSPGANPNDHAIVLVVSYGSTDVLLTADAESNVTLPLRPPAVEVIKVAHHGSADDGLPELLALLRPRIAVISVGDGNTYGHPTPETLAALEAAPGLTFFRTDEDGRVVIESDGRRLTIRKEP